jgi:HEAT repeat protein
MHPRERVLPLVKAALQASGPLRVAALVAVAKIGDASLEADMIAAQESDIPQVRAAAVEALGAIGTTAAVPHLRALAERSGTLEFELRRAVDNAVAKIRSRFPAAGAGQVALAEEGDMSAAGRVSLTAGGAAGNVALAPGVPEGCPDRRD